MENISKNKPCKDFVKKLKSGSQVILLRHAETKYNELKKGLLSREHTEEDILRIKTNLDNWDTSLTQFGMQQWEITAEVVSKLKVEIVLVSPMKRTMQTAYNVFKNHSNFNNIEFVVVPKLKELLGSVADIPKDLFRTINQFKDKFPNFNCSLIQDYNDMRHFYYENIKLKLSKIISKSF